MATPIYNKATLEKGLNGEWKGFNVELCQKLMDTMPERLIKCLLAKEDHFS